MAESPENQTNLNDDSAADATSEAADAPSTEADNTATTPPADAEQVDEPPTEERVTIEGIMEQLNVARTEAQTNLEGWQRSRAEFVNYKRRTSQELVDSRERGAQEAIAKFIPIIDDFERALDNIPQEFEGHQWMTGTALILKNMHKVLEQYNVEIVDPVGQEFDPNLHEAVGMDDSSDYDSGIVTTTLQKGYMSDGRVIRPALVRVAN